MTTHTATNIAGLRRRIDNYIGSPSGKSADIARIISLLSRAGNVLLFGGFVRDIALFGTRAQPSDIDLVVQVRPGAKLDELLGEMRASRNRYGGFRFSSGRWNFDAWDLEHTWAFRSGLVPGTGVDALLRTTFFDWDAIAYDFERRQLHCEERYFEIIASRIVDINLLDNPNPIGNAMRAIRILETGRGRLSRRLASYVIDVLEPVYASDEVPQTYSISQLRRSMALIREGLSDSDSEAIGPPSKQLALDVSA
jgi:hypothetical protein